MSALKALLSAAVALAGALVVGLGTGNNGSLGSLDLKTWLLAGLAVLGSGGVVYACQNITGVAGTAIKAIVAFLSAGIASLVTALNDTHITQAELLVAFVAAVSATGLVYQATNSIRTSRR